MRQYELAIRIAQIHHLIDERKYKKALTVVRALDMRQIKSLSDLSAIADVYAKTEQYDAAKATYLRIYRKSRTRRILYKLIYLAIRTNEIDEAEKYYQEFVNMNSNARDAIILRYRIDKAAGVPIGRLIETLEELKEEEYIEEWAYELAKMYHKAGRREECRRECEDILLWFGHGEIVERAKKLIEYVDDNEAMPYLDDKDFTIKDKEEPNPDDTGSLPDLNEYLQAKSQLDDYNKSGRDVKDSKDKGNSDEDVKKEEKKPENIKNGTKSSNDKKEFIDDYDEEDFDIDADLGRIAKEGFHKLSGFLRFGGKKDTSEPAEEEAATKKRDECFGSDEDIHTEVSADMKKNEIKSSKKTDSKPYDKSYDKNVNNSKDAKNDKNGSNNKNSKINNNKQSGKKTVSVKVKRNKPEEKPIIPVYSQSGTGITQDLSKEISAIYEAEHREQLKEKAVTVIRERKHAGKEAVSVIERMTNAVKNDESKNISPAGVEEIGMSDTKVIAVNKTDTAKGKKDVLGSILEADLAELQAKKAQEEAIAKAEEARIKAEEAQRIWEEAERKRAEAEAAISGNYNSKSNKEDKEINKEISKETDIKAEEESKESEVILPKDEEVTNDNIKEDEKVQEPDNNTNEEEAEEVSEAYNNEEKAEEVGEAYNNEEKAEEVSEAYNNEEKAEEVSEVYNNEEEAEEVSEAYNNEEEAEEVSEAYNNEEEAEEEVNEAYNNAEEEIVEEAAADNFEINELSDDDLPTTRALHTSFDDILTLIGGEPDPSHFVFVGNSSDLIVGLSKRIIKVMKETGYMSIGRIAKISAKKLNSMNINEFKSQLKGNCLLIDEAAELMVPTIASVFKMMDEFYGDFVVILADDGNTLDQLFRFAPALAKRFKYIIDISGYTENDC